MMKQQTLPWQDYPRPQLRREDWLCLNGTWDLEFEGKTRRVQVPFCVESRLSGLEDPPEPGCPMVYSRGFSIPEGWQGQRVLLHFGAVMRQAEVSVNGTALCRHENGYLPFTVEITDALRAGENELTVRVVNDLAPRWPWGKQRRKRGGMWYTPCSGIWQTVWLEPVPRSYIRSLELRTGLDWAELRVEGIAAGTVELEGREYPLQDGSCRIRLDRPRLWSPEDPYLYHFTLRGEEDRVRSYFALRTLSVETVEGLPRLCLNGKPYFFHGLLDQGYWRDGLYTPPTPEGFAQDILAMKRLGFNTLRKHIKVEPARFYCDCDRLGMIVFQDMVNNGPYRFLRDTALPTVGLLRRNDARLNPDPRTRETFLQAMEDTVRLLENHPCVCLWTVFNEGWGQFCADEAYRRLKAIDPGRFVDSTSGWFHQKASDVDSLHIYFRKLRLGKQRLPQLLSEFGGYVWKDPAHCFNPKKTYGYRIFKTREAFVRGLRDLYGSLIPLIVQGLCGAIYTQVSDVEDETNGLFTFDREVLKLRPEEFTDLSEQLKL